MALILDTGVLLAYIDERQRWHEAVAALLQAHGPPYFTVEAVLSELSFLLQRDKVPASMAVELIAQGAVEAVPVLDRSANRVLELMRRYTDVPMALADACLVCLSELEHKVPIATFDRDFLIYRRFRREPLLLADVPLRVQEASPAYADP